MTPPGITLPSERVTGPTVRVVALVAEPGEAVADTDRSTEWEVLAVSRSAGGTADTAQLFRKLSRAGRMRNRTISELQTQAVEVWTLDTLGELDRPLFWGEMDTRSMRLSPGGETETATASVRPYHFGEPLRGMQVWDSAGGATLTVEHDAEFNPLVDGRIIDNMMRKQADGGFPAYKLWFLPESTRTELAYEQHGTLVSPYPWDLRSIIETLSGWMNPDETFVLNHVSPEDETEDDLSAAPIVKNIRLKRGQYLPQLLDSILPPFGFGWFLDYGTDSSITLKPRITIYRRGIGTEKKLYMPGLSESATLKHNADHVDLVANLWQLANQVRVDGSIVEREVTIPLYRAWPEADDSTTLADMTKSTGGSAAFGPIWRKFAANEAGDYSSTRVTVDVIPATPPDLDTVFGAGDWVVRRRMIENCLTWEDSEKTRRRPALIEWSDDTGSTWSPIDPNWGCHVLRDEIGVMFTNDKPPEEIVAAGDNARLRITGTLQGDQRLTSTAARQATNPNANAVEIVVDASDQFHDRDRQATGTYASVLSGNMDDADDSAAIATFAETIRSQREAVMLQASVDLFGLISEYQIGDIITELTGRDIKLNRLPQGEGGRYLQIVGIAYDITAQRTKLSVQPYDR